MEDSDSDSHVVEMPSSSVRIKQILHKGGQQTYKDPSLFLEPLYKENTYGGEK